MHKSAIPNIPGFDAMTDTLDFVKNLWGSMGVPGMSGIPGMVMPSLSVEEINKQIADLKAVESWLALNMNMLRTTIQALEVQSATLATLQAMGETLSAAVRPTTPGKARPEAPASRQETASVAPEPPAESKSEANGESAKFTPPPVDPAAWWNLLQNQFKQAVNTAMATETPAPAPKAAAKPTPKPRAAPRKRKPAAKKE